MHSSDLASAKQKKKRTERQQQEEAYFGTPGASGRPGRRQAEGIYVTKVSHVRSALSDRQGCRTYVEGSKVLVSDGRFLFRARSLE